MIKLITMLVLTALLVMSPGAGVQAQSLSPVHDCFAHQDNVVGIFSGVDEQFRGNAFTLSGADQEVFFIYAAMYKTGSQSGTFRFEIREYPNYPSNFNFPNIVWASASLDETDLLLNPDTPVSLTDGLRVPVTLGTMLESGKTYGYGHVTETTNPGGALVRRWDTGAADCLGETHLGSLTNATLAPTGKLGLVLYGLDDIAVVPTPVPEYDGNELIDGLVDGGAETDIGKGIIGGAIGVAIVGVIGALIGPLLGLVLGGILAIMLLVALGIIPPYSLVAILPLLLIAAYVRYALGGASR